MTSKDTPPIEPTTGQVYAVWNLQYEVGFSISLGKLIREGPDQESQTWTCAPYDPENPQQPYDDILVAKFTSRRPSSPTELPDATKYLQNKLAFRMNVESEPFRHVSPTLAYRESIPNCPYDFLIVQLRYLPLKELLAPKGKWYTDKIMEHRTVLKSFMLLLGMGLAQFSVEEIDGHDSEESTACHNDPKESNFVFDQFEKTLKIIDTGSVARLPAGKFLLNSNHSGTMGYFAPERTANLVTRTSDVFGYAMTIGSIMNGGVPLSPADFTEVLTNSEDQVLSKLLLHCIDPAARQRPTLPTVVCSILETGFQIDEAEECLRQFLHTSMSPLPKLPLQHLKGLQEYVYVSDASAAKYWERSLGKLPSAETFAGRLPADKKPSQHPIELIWQSILYEPISEMDDTAEPEDSLFEPPAKRRKLDQQTSQLDPAQLSPQSSAASEIVASDVEPEVLLLTDEEGTAKCIKKRSRSPDVSNWVATYKAIHEVVKKRWERKHKKLVYDTETDAQVRQVLIYLSSQTSPTWRDFIGSARSSLVSLKIAPDDETLSALKSLPSPSSRAYTIVTNFLGLSKSLGRPKANRSKQTETDINGGHGDENSSDSEDEKTNLPAVIEPEPEPRSLMSDL